MSPPWLLNDLVKDKRHGGCVLRRADSGCRWPQLRSPAGFEPVQIPLTRRVPTPLLNTPKHHKTEDWCPQRDANPCCHLESVGEAEVPRGWENRLRWSGASLSFHRYWLSRIVLLPHVA